LGDRFRCSSIAIFSLQALLPGMASTVSSPDGAVAASSSSGKDSSNKDPASTTAPDDDKKKVDPIAALLAQFKDKSAELEGQITALRARQDRASCDLLAEGLFIAFILTLLAGLFGAILCSHAISEAKRLDGIVVVRLSESLQNAEIQKMTVNLSSPVLAQDVNTHTARQQLPFIVFPGNGHAYR
jgi:hypothetical protein